mmetsp:Transcript_77729/g.219820  ORF Transcript_77729/g.219820 Transcript_77729/m.219820 type:complete len:338 (-) Transcript_77729:40-1053(-)
MKPAPGARRKQRFQAKNGKHWVDLPPSEDQHLRAAYLAGLPRVTYSVGGVRRECCLRTMTQTDARSGKARRIRAPHGWTLPAAPITEAVPHTCVKVPRGASGTIIHVPRGKGASIPVKVPATAKAGQRLMVPIVAPGARRAGGGGTRAGHGSDGEALLPGDGGGPTRQYDARLLAAAVVPAALMVLLVYLRWKRDMKQPWVAKVAVAMGVLASLLAVLGVSEKARTCAAWAVTGAAAVVGVAAAGWVASKLATGAAVVGGFTLTGLVADHDPGMAAAAADLDASPARGELPPDDDLGDESSVASDDIGALFDVDAALGGGAAADVDDILMEPLLGLF